MSFYHLSASIIGRGAGRSAVACAAYRSGTRLVDERYGEVHDYTPRRGISAHGILAPEHAPQWMADRERLWNSVEARERRKDAQLSREFNLAFPDGVDEKVRLELLETFLREQITSRGLVADWAIHSPSKSGDQRNWHAHVMTTLRAASPEGFDANKDRELNRPEQLKEWRAAWAEVQNRAFERYQIRGVDGEIRKVDHRSYEDRGLDIEPTIHLGPHATAMERRGEATELGDHNREVQERNEERQAVRRTAIHLIRTDARMQILPDALEEVETPLAANDNPKPDITRRRAQVLPANEDPLDTEGANRTRREFNDERTRSEEPRRQRGDRGRDLDR